MSNAPYKALLLDLDGTLVDTAPDFIEVVNALRAELLKTPPLDTQTVRCKVSKGAKALTSLASEVAIDHPDFEDYKARLLSHYERFNGEKAVFFEGMIPLLTWCQNQGLPWGIVTNKPAHFAEPLVAKLCQPFPPGTLVCPDYVTLSKPDPESLYFAANALGVPAHKCIYVGDHERDIIAGRAAGMFTIAALYGYLDADAEPQLWGHRAQANSGAELFSLVRTLV